MNAKYGMPATPMNRASAMNGRSRTSTRTPRIMAPSDAPTPPSERSSRGCVSEISSDSAKAKTPHAVRKANTPRQSVSVRMNVPRNGAAAGPMMMSDCSVVMASCRSLPA